jgi:site-specific recombinase XerD
MPKTESATLLDAYSLFLLDCKAQKFTTSTIDFYKNRLPKFFDWCKTEGVTTLDQLKPTHIRGYLVHCQERNLKDNTLHGFARAIRRFCNFVVSEELISVSPFAKVKMPKVAKQILPSLTTEQVKRVLTACDNDRDKAVVLFLVDTGARASELVRLNYSHLDLKTGAVFIERGKMSKDRHVFIGARTQKQLQRYLMRRKNKAPGDPLFAALDGQRLTTSGLRQLLIRVGRAAGVDHCAPHALRRTFALWSLRAGMNVYALQRLMGHDDLTTLLSYLGLTKDDLRDAHDQHGAVDSNL